MGTENQTMVKGFEVEVCSLEEGLKGSYFRAVLEENTGHKKVSVRYLTLLSDDGSSPLTEAVQQSLLRPVPPEEEYSGVVLEEGTVVDAYFRDGWWTGVVINKKLEDDNYLVCFDSPPDIIMFEKTKLRAHLDWTDSKWVRPDLKEVDKSMFCPGTMVEVSSVLGTAVVAWFPAMLIKEIEENGEKKFIVKDCNHQARPNTTVDPRRVRPTPPPSSGEEYDLMDCVEAFHGSTWRQGLVKGIMTGKCYKVFLEATKEEHLFSQSHVRPLMVWEDGAWHDVSKEKTPSSVMKPKTVTLKRTRQHVRGSLNPEQNGVTLTKAQTVAAAAGELRNKKADAVVMTGETPPPVITPQVTPIAKESASVLTPSPPATPLKQTGTETEGHQSSEKTPEPGSKHNGLGNDSIQQKTPEEKETSQVMSRKRKREEQQHSDLNETDKTCNGSKAVMNGTSKDICSNESDVDCQLIASSTEVSSSSSHQTPNVMMNSAAATTNVEETPPARMGLPFTKRSPYWKSSEAKEGYKTMPQRPHFSPLIEATDDDHREWSAVGMMVTFYGLLEEIKALKVDDSMSVFCSLKDSFVKLEKHGFDIDAPQARISKMMSLKDEQAKKAEEKECLEKKIDEDEKKRRELGEEMAELKRRMLELQRQEAVAKEEQEAADKRVVEMKASRERVEQEIEDVELEFLKTVSALW